jgi:hypothetical protein
MNYPKEFYPVLAEIKGLSDGGCFAVWYEVIYYYLYHNRWCSFAGSNTFENGETVTKWKYCSDIL